MTEWPTFQINGKGVLWRLLGSSRVGFVFGESFLRKPIACACALGRNIGR
jgi:hypothetical protein